MKIIFCDSPNLAMSTPWSIRIGMPFWNLSKGEQAAVLLHELAHHRLRHSWWHLAYVFAWPFAPQFFAAKVKEHEHEADEFVVSKGLGSALIQLLARHLNDDPGPLHPSAAERIARARAAMEKLPHGKR